MRFSANNVIFTPQKHSFLANFISVLWSHRLSLSLSSESSSCHHVIMNMSMLMLTDINWNSKYYHNHHASGELLHLKRAGKTGSPVWPNLLLGRWTSPPTSDWGYWHVDMMIKWHDRGWHDEMTWPWVTPQGKISLSLYDSSVFTLFWRHWNMI